MNLIHLKTKTLRSKQYKSLKQVLGAADGLEALPGGLDYTVFADRQNKKIGMALQGLLHQNRQYRTVGFTKVGKMAISTVWIGHNMSHAGGNPIVFESAYMPDEGHIDPCDRYDSEWDAVRGHCKLVLELKGDPMANILSEFTAKVKPENQQAFADMVMKLKLMKDVMGKKFMVELIGQDLPKKLSRRQRKKKASQMWADFCVAELKRVGMEVTRGQK